jgi:hypothetical protein
MLGTLYPKSVIVAPESPLSSGLRVIKEASSNKKLGKLGKRIQKGRFKDMPMYAVTLEERATCSPTCPNLDICYGDNMPFATRHTPGPELEDALRADVQHLSKKHPKGFVVRLHVLGDFYSVEYVQFWFRLLLTYEPLRLFGYTHWQYDHPIGKAVTKLVKHFGDRVAFRRSDKTIADDPLPSAMTIGQNEPPVPGTVICPEQTGRTAACTTCGLCLDTMVSVSFIDHSRRGLRTLPLAA